MGFVNSGWPIIGGVVIFGVGLIWYLVGNDRKVYSEPILNLSTPPPGQGAQASQVANLIGGIQRTTALINARYPEK